MPDVRLMVACQQVIVDTFSNAVSVIGVLDSLTLASVPTVIPRLMVLVVLERRDEDDDIFSANISVRLNGIVLGSSLGSVKFAGLHMARIVVDLGNLVVSAPGELRFCLESNAKSLGEYVVAVELTSPTFFEPPVEIKNPAAG